MPTKNMYKKVLCGALFVLFLCVVGAAYYISKSEERLPVTDTYALCFTQDGEARSASRVVQRAVPRACQFDANGQVFVVGVRPDGIEIWSKNAPAGTEPQFIQIDNFQSLAEEWDTDRLIQLEDMTFDGHDDLAVLVLSGMRIMEYMVHPFSPEKETFLEKPIDTVLNYYSVDQERKVVTSSTFESGNVYETEYTYENGAYVPANKNVVPEYVPSEMESGPVSQDIDSSCLGDEVEYGGEIQPGKQVKIVLSCDRTMFTISGAVNQVISSSDLPESISYSEHIELADLISGSLVVDLEDDYNFDGYNDISSVYINGQGSMAVDSVLYYLYDPVQNVFVFHEELSKLKNLSVESESQETLKQYFSYGWGYGGKEVYWQWENGNLVKMREVEIEGDR